MEPVDFFVLMFFLLATIGLGWTSIKVTAGLKWAYRAVNPPAGRRRRT